MQPRYQIFVSSTFRDLREERQAALDAILELSHFPAGMEIFPAADATPWELIRAIIADSDYYVLIIGGKYGSTGPDGISYTEMEFNLAVELNKPILAFVHGAPDEIPVGRSELSSEARKRLEAFRTRVSERHCKSWRTKDELKAAILLAIVHVIRTKPAAGWVRNEGLENRELLKRLAVLQGRYDALEEEAKELRVLVAQRSDTEKYQSLDETFSVSFTVGREKALYKVDISWSDLFFGVAEFMLIPCTEYKLSEQFSKVIVGAIVNTEKGAELMRHRADIGSLERDVRLTEEALKAITLQLMAQGLIEPKHVLRQGGTYTTSDRCWELTPAGRRHYLDKIAVPNSIQS